MMADLHLDTDVDLRPCNNPSAPPIMEWMEAELFDNFLDFFEAGLGAETESLRNARARVTMTDTDREAGTGLIARLLQQVATHPEREAVPQDKQEQGARAGNTTSLGTRTPRMSRRTSPPSCTGGTTGNQGGTEGGVSADGDAVAEKREADRGTEGVEGTSRMPEQDALGRGSRRRRDGWHPPRAGGSQKKSRGNRVRPQRDLRDGAGQMDIVEATGRWFLLLGLRHAGNVRDEPSNALTREAQRRARAALQPLSDYNLQVMYRGLLRLMGMLFIEGARLLTQVHDRHLREPDMVEVEIDDDDDDESLYMQTSLTTLFKPSWEDQLQALVREAEAGKDSGTAKTYLRVRLLANSPRGSTTRRPRCRDEPDWRDAT